MRQETIVEVDWGMHETRRNNFRFPSSNVKDASLFFIFWSNSIFIMDIIKKCFKYLGIVLLVI